MVACLAGCAFSPVDRPSIEGSAISKTEPFASTEDAAIAASKISLKAMGYEVSSFTPEMGQMRTNNYSVAIAENCNCGEWNSRPIAGNAQSSLQIRVDPKGSGSVLLQVTHVCTINFVGRNLWGMPTRRETYQCASTGRIESEFLDGVRRVLAHR
jgi:hypothetical protein